MAFTRKQLTEIGLSPEHIEKVMTLHGTSMSDYILKSEVDNSAEKSVRAAFGLKDNEEIGDISKRLADRDAVTLKTSNDRLIAAEIKSLEGYDPELLMAVMDKVEGHMVSVDDKGAVTGVKELAEAAATKFPAIKLAPKAPPFSPTNPGNPPTGSDYETRLKTARETGNIQEAVLIKQEAAAKGVSLI